MAVWEYTFGPRPRYMNFFKPFQVLAGDHLVFPTGVSHISLRHKKYNQGSGRKRTKNKRTIGAWVSSKCKKRSYVTLHSLCICRLTLAWISSEISTKLLGMPSHLDWSSLTAAELSLIPTGLFCCPVLTAHCPSASPVANCLLSGFLLPSLWLAFPRLLPVASRSRAQAFVCFRAKTDKGIIVADHPHSVTVVD